MLFVVARMRGSEGRKMKEGVEEEDEAEDKDTARQNPN
jgi:hypothetical protein